MTIYSAAANSALANNHDEQPRLLVVDDDADSAQALQLYLTRHGYEVRVAYSGQSALEEIRRSRPHLLILDLLMPDLSGLDITMQLRADHKAAYIPIIIITAQDQERKRLQSMLSGADDYLSKPVSELELLVRVQALLRTKMQIDHLWQENHGLLHSIEARNIELEQALQAVEEANLLKQNILNTVSHEMGTPMLQIKTAVHLLVEDVTQNEPENIPAKLVNQAVNRLEGIISNLTALARSENMKPEPFLLPDALELALRGVEKTARERVLKQVEPGLPPVYGDRRGLARVLTILIDNALKFDPAGNPVRVIGQREGETEVWVAVMDQGIGIPIDQQDRIFEEFYQIDSSTTRRFGGSGLGLALAKLLCDRMDILIRVDSEEGRGSTFSFILPIASLE